LNGHAFSALIGPAAAARKENVMSYRNILSERVEQVALITLNRPEKLNAMSYELACELDVELTTLEGDDDVRAIVLTGAGPRAFSSGGDIYQMAKSSAEDLAARSEVRRKATWHLADFSKPIIGAINGLAYGAGAQLASMLDIRIGCEHAEFRFLAARYGRANSTWSLPHGTGNQAPSARRRRPALARALRQ
jgi:enoyl-CoA hydratase/carnithine racemase